MLSSRFAGCSNTTRCRSGRVSFDESVAAADLNGRRYNGGVQHASDHAVLVVQRKYGVSGKIVPKELFRLVQDKDPARSKRVMKAMLQMVKLDVARLQQAANES